MTSETFLKGLDLSDALIAESDPEDFHKKVRLFRKRILSIGALVAAVVLCVTVGWMRFFPTQPDGDPSVQLPPTVTITDTDTDTQTTTTDATDRMLGAHFHYKGKMYWHSWNGSEDGVIEIPDGFSLIGEVELRMSCVTGSTEHRTPGDLGLYGTNENCKVYMDEEEVWAYMDDGTGVYWPYKLYIAQENSNKVLFESQEFE